MDGGDERRGPRWVFLSDLGRTELRRQRASRYGWRLVAANNRPLGRAVQLADTLDGCVAQARRVHEGADRMRTAVHTRGDESTWYWRALLDDETVAVCTRPFARRAECARALAQFVDAARRAEPHPRDVRHYGAQALRGYRDSRDATTPTLRDAAR